MTTVEPDEVHDIDFTLLPQDSTLAAAMFRAFAKF